MVHAGGHNVETKASVLNIASKKPSTLNRNGVPDATSKINTGTHLYDVGRSVESGSHDAVEVVPYRRAV